MSSVQPLNQSQTPDKKVLQVNPILEDLQKYLAELKNYSMQKFCTVNSYIDAMDSRNQWCVGKIISIDQKGMMDIRFDGWSDKYIEKIFINSRKIDSFRKWTFPYTGGVKSTMRDDLTIEKMREESNAQIEEMSLLENDDFNIQNVNTFIQNFRGRYFFLADNILSNNKPFQDNDIQQFIEFFQIYIKVFIKYIKLLPQSLPTYIEAINLNRNLFLVHPKVALVSGFPEIFYLMNSLFGGEQRCMKFFKSNRFEFQTHQDPFAIKSKDGQAPYQDQILNFINYFGIQFGFDNLFDLISWETKVGNDIVYQTPIPIIKCIVDVFVRCLIYMPSKKQSHFANNLKKRIFDRFNKISDKELKDLDIQKAKSTINQLGDCLANILGNQIYEEAEKLEIRCIIKLIKCPFLEKKILGVSQFRDIISRASANNKQYYQKDIYPYQYFDRQKLKEYLEQENLLDFFLGENFHPEIFKRSIEILGFLSEENALLPKHIEQIWKLTENKHEADLAAIYSVIIELSKMLQEQSLNQLYKYIITIPFDQYTELTISLVKEFTLNATSSMNFSYQSKTQFWKNKTIVLSQEYPNFGLPKLWGCIQDSNKVSNQLVSICVDSLSELFKSNFFSSNKEQYLQFCFDNLKNGTSVPQSLQLAIFLIKTYSSNSSFLGVGELNSESITQKYNKDYNFMEAIVKDFENYMRQVLQKIKKTGVILDEKQGEEVFIGKYGHIQNIDIRLEFISLINKHLSNKQKDITIEQLKKLWKILVRSSITNIEKNKFLTWLNKKRQNNNDNNNNNKNVASSLLDENLLSQALDQIFCDKELMNGFQIDKEIFDCLKNIFQMVNLKNKSIELNNQQLILINKYDQIVGKEVFWNLSLYCIDPQVLEEVRQLLVNIHLRKTLKSQETKPRMWGKFTEKCHEILSQAKSPQVQSHIVLMIKIFLQEIEGKMFFGDRRQEMNIAVTLLNQNNNQQKRATLKLQSNISILKLRKEISKEFKLINKDFEMLFSNRNILLSKIHEEEYSIDALNTNDDKTPHIIVQNIKDTNQDLIELTSFKFNLANSQFADILLDFLSTGQSDEIVNNAWDILNLIPKNNQILKKLQSIETEELNPSSWNLLLPSNCFRKLQYFFQIITQEFLMTGSDGNLKKEQDQWCQAFILKGGLRHILTIYLNLCSETNFDKPFNLYCISTLVEIIGVLMRLYYNQFQKEFLVESQKITQQNEFLNSLVQRTINYIGFGLKKSDQFFSPFGNSSLSLSQSLSYLASSIIINGNRIANDQNLSVNRLLVQNYLLSFFRGTFELISLCFEQDEPLIKTYLHEQSKNFDPIFQGLLILDDDQIRNQLQISLVKVIDLDSTNQAHIIFENNLSKIILSKHDQIQNEYRSKCYEFFQLYQKVLQHLENKRLIGTAVNPKSFIQTMKTIISLIDTCNPYEKTRQDVDGMLRGAFQCLQQLIQMDSLLAQVVIKDEKLIQNIIYDCLFSIKSDENPYAPKCKSRQSRLSAFSFLVALQNQIIQQQIQEKDIVNEEFDANQQINQFFVNAHWRTKSKGDWSIKEEQEKEENCPIGLRNLGCTCYMNSLIQQLFMIREFSDSLQKVDAQTSEKEYNPKENVLYQIQQIFSALSYSQRQYYDPRDFCQAFKDLDGQPINVFQQMDVDEFFNTLMDRLETLLKPSKNDFIIKNIFEGSLANELIGKGGGCTHNSEREESFLAISLPTKSKKTLYECLQSFFQGEMLDGDNSYFCEKCDKKVPTLRLQSIKKLPNQLLIVLKRFHFDLDVMQKIKINSYCEFPDKLNLKQYSQAYLKQKDLEEDLNQQSEQGDANSKQNDIKKIEGQEDNIQAQLSELFPDDYYKYSLKGVVIHQGTSDSGHYYSLIKQQDEKWLEFNDTIVRPFDVNDLPSEAFGGESDLSFNNGNQSMNLNNKMQNVNNKNAYLLFYERDVFFDSEGKPTPCILDQNLIQNPTNLTKENIVLENKKLHLNKYLFSYEMIEYTQKLLEIIDPDNQTDYSNKLCKFLIKYYFFCRQRQNDKNKFPSFRKKLGAILSKNYNLSTWFIYNASNESFIKENFLDSQHDEMKYLSAGLIIEAINCVCDQENSLPYETFVKKSVIVHFLNISIYILHTQSQTDMKVLDQFYRMICRVAEVSKNSRQYLLKQKMVGRLQAAFMGARQTTNGYQDINNYRQQGQAENSEFALDLQIEQEKSQKIQSIDEILEGKERNKRLNSLQKNVSYLVKMHSILVRSVSPFINCQIPENIYLAFPRIDHPIDSDEIDTFKGQGFTKYIFSQNIQYKKMVRNYLAQTYAYLTAENQQLTQDLMTSMYAIFNEARFDDISIKFYFIFLKHFLLINDSQEKKRANYVKQKVQNFISQNYKFFYSAQICIDSMIKMSTLSKNFAYEMQKELQENKDLLKCLDYFLRESSNIYNALNNNSMALFKDNRQYNLNIQAIQKYQQNIKSQNNLRRQKIQNLQNLCSQPLEYDSDDDYAEKTVKINDRVDYRQNGEIYSFIVVDSMVDMFQIQNEKDTNYCKWVKYDDDSLLEPIKAQKYYQYYYDYLHF
ncbi:hypothetical protein ABPG72_002395 [Tetrahymena utriculariae]